ncbi:hypothetical protein TNCV_4337891 [Trichonephila clavipes]|uniref:Uncharacterized protein n=1 Tax=Trichonephila clavipes TaxID=2585209 RepID=A0A8X6T1R6_TRICX|nr:hypothetical protein TNCV_4337891 [Trichonephila clavipes]
MEPISSYITKLARNVFRSIENHDNPIIRAQTMFTYPHPKLKYAYATAKWKLPLKPPYKRLRRWHLKILISVPTSSGTSSGEIRLAATSPYRPEFSSPAADFWTLLAKTESAGTAHLQHKQKLPAFFLIHIIITGNF